MDRENNNNISEYTISEQQQPISSARRIRSTNHFRSASWSHQNISQTLSNSNTMETILSPIRVIQEMVAPGLGGSVVSSNRPTTTHTVSGPNLENNRLSSTTRHLRTRSDTSRNLAQTGTVEIDINDSTENPAEPVRTQQENHLEFSGTISWVEKSFPFCLLLLSRIMWDHRLGILVFIGLFGTYFQVNNKIRKQVGLKEKRLNRVCIGIFLFLAINIFFIYFVFNSQNLQNCLIFQRPYFKKMDLWTVFWAVGITDFVVRFLTMAIKCVVIVLPRRLIQFRKRGKYFLVLENLSQLYRCVLPAPHWYLYFTDYNIGGEYFALLSTSAYILLKIRMLFLQGKILYSSIQCLSTDTQYGKPPSKELLIEFGDACPICQEVPMEDPIELNACKHIFCEDCIIMWFDRERTCPMCRAKVADDPLWRDGNTQAFIQIF